MITANELRQKFLKFFETKNHAILPSFSIVPENDPTSLFISSGMQPLVPFLMGEKHPQGNRLADVQKCIRTIDIEEVGDNTHHTFFEMLGNWSLGDYFKKEAIQWSYEFLTSSQWLGLDKERLAVSVFEGDKDAPFDKESFEYWQGLGFSEDRIAKLSKSENWWGPPSETGPCGPDSEIFYWTGSVKEIPKKFDPENDKWVEIWNNVFMEYEKTSDGSFKKLAQQNVDTGMGLERVVAILNGMKDDYQSEVFQPIIKRIEELSNQKYQENNQKSFRIIADHLKASVFMVADGIQPSNTERGYILRRLIRRAVREAHKIGIDFLFTDKIAEVVQKIYQETYPEVVGEEILSSIKEEEQKFQATLEKGLKQFDKIVSKKQDVVLVSSNPNKIREYQELIKDRMKLSFYKSGLPEIQSVDSTEVAQYKIIEAYKLIKRPIIVEDTALHLEAWNGFPGALIKWLEDYLGTQGILDLVENKNRNAQAKCVIAYFDGKEISFFEGVVKGKITEERKGNNKIDFGFDPIFVPEGYDKTFAELGEEKNKISHRQKALEKFITGKPDHKIEIDKDIADSSSELVITGKEAFNLFQTFGFPIEMIEDLAYEKGLRVNRKEFEKELNTHQELSRTASAGMFKGGLADTKEKTKQLHTVAHLLLAGLRKVLGDGVAQKGSNINGERVRFDFNYGEALTPEQIKAVEDFINQAIQEKIPVVKEEMSLEEAQKTGAHGTFENKYGDLVNVYTIGDYSKEICGGPHVENTGEIEGNFKIVKEKSSSSGVRRIKGVLA
jgi:non-canonical purine NTP pyrophosphatase (RdgB/HAM1 family)